MRAKLTEIADQVNLLLTDKEFALEMDAQDPCRELRNCFFYPKMKTLPGIDLNRVSGDDDSIYLCGNSLGLEPKNTPQLIQKELNKWAEMGVHGHRNGDLPWAFCDEYVLEGSAKLVGASQEEIGVMNGLSINLHLLMVSFYRPTEKRYKIMMETKAFPSDHYIVESQLRYHGFDTEKAMICVEPREGEDCLREEDILKRIENEGDSIALVLFGGVQYYTGQFFDIPAITQAAQKKGCYVGWDLAHAVGNVPLKLSEWGVDFAAWCNYKYVNSGAGGIAGVFLHKKHSNNDFPKFLGWWGHKIETRFNMDNDMDIARGPFGYRVSNPPPLLCCPLLASLEVFAKTSMEELRSKSMLLTAYLEFLIEHYFSEMSDCRKSMTHCRILTPKEPERRGAQLSLFFSSNLHSVFEELVKYGVVCDKRMPNVIRIAPAPLYNSFLDVFRFCEVLQKILITENRRV